MKLKLDEKGQVVLENGLPVWVADDGKEIAYDVPRLIGDLSRVNSESAGRRKDIDALNEKLKAFEGIDPVKYQEMQAKLADIDLNKMGNVDEIRKSVSQSFEQRMAEDAAKHKAEMDEMWGVVRDSQVRGIFDSSTFLREKTTLPPDIANSFFGKNFKVERDGNGLKIVALDSQGNPLLSRVNPGAYATPDEALEHYVQNYPQRDVFLRSPAGGPGTQGGKGDMNKNTISRAEFDKLDPAAKVAFVKDGKGAVTD